MLSYRMNVIYVVADFDIDHQDIDHSMDIVNMHYICHLFDFHNKLKKGTKRTNILDKFIYQYVRVYFD